MHHSLSFMRLLIRLRLHGPLLREALMAIISLHRLSFKQTRKPSEVHSLTPVGRSNVLRGDLRRPAVFTQQPNDVSMFLLPPPETRPVFGRRVPPTEDITNNLSPCVDAAWRCRLNDRSVSFWIIKPHTPQKPLTSVPFDGA